MEIHISGSPVHVVTLSPSLPQPERRPQPPRRFTPAFSMPCSVPTVWPKLVHLHFAFRWPSPPFTVPPTLIHFIQELPLISCDNDHFSRLASPPLRDPSRSVVSLLSHPS